MNHKYYVINIQKLSFVLGKYMEFIQESSNDSINLWHLVSSFYTQLYNIMQKKPHCSCCINSRMINPVSIQCRNGH